MDAVVVRRRLIRWLRLIGLALLSVFLVAGLGQCGAWQGVAQSATDFVFLPNSGIVNVKAAPYGAKGDGQTDDTAAIQAAIAENRTQLIYFPKGTYLVSDTIRVQASNGQQKRFFLQGESQSETIIRLADQNANFQDSEAPRPIVSFWEGEVNDATAFRNQIRGLTIEAGENNPGAIALRFRANNYGSVENVTLRSRDRQYQGRYGLDLSVGLNGPLLVKNLVVDGFEVGVHFAGALHSATFANLQLQHQQQYGLYNRRQVLSIYGLKSQNRVPAIVNDSEGYPAHGLITLVDADLQAGARDTVAIDNTHGGGLYARNVRTEGYQAAIANATEANVTEITTPVAEFVSHPVRSLFASPERSLQLPIEPAPSLQWPPLADWLQVEPSGEDDTAAIQAAIDAGKPIVYFAAQEYTVSAPIEIRGSVQALVGLGAASLKTSGALRDSDQPVFRLVEGRSPTVWIEGLETNLGKAFFIEQASPRSLVLRHLGTGGYRNLAAGSRLFIEDVAGWRWYFRQQQVWAWQLNTEASSESGSINIDNEGADVWILGLKTERDVPVVTTHAGGRTELLGGFLYGNREIPAGTAAFSSEDASQSLVFAGYNHAFEPYVSEIRQGDRRHLSASAVYPIKYGRMMPLFVGYSAADRAVEQEKS
ncbi:glycoside hydrolase family 55 protein [Almyronema epifaneia]|uniref:Glycosyl hydrolase family 28-related protein n=1 Tax=Almyronema epifaneia S1 TaxID=2991925 RepID=A0ABW6IAT7_9CYAN